jgi:hypothetical protein
MGSSPHRRKHLGTVKLFPMVKLKSKQPERESVMSWLPQDILAQLKALDVGVQALTLQIKAEQIYHKSRTKAARQGTKL